MKENINVCIFCKLLGAGPLHLGQLDKTPAAKRKNGTPNPKCLYNITPFSLSIVFSRCFRLSGDVKAFQSPQLENVHLHFEY